MKKSKSIEKYNITLEIFENGNAKTPVVTWVFQKLHEGGDAPNRQREKKSKSLEKHSIVYFNVKRQYKNIRRDLGFSKFIEDIGVVNRFSEKKVNRHKNIISP